jgi:hypothetical protein
MFIFGGLKMNKKLFMSGILISIFLLVVNTAFALTALNTDPSAGNPGTSVSGSFVLTNDNAVEATGITLTVTDLTGVTDASKSIVASSVSFSPASISSLANATTQNITTTVAISENLISQTYQGTVTVSGTVSGTVVSTSFPLSVTVSALSTIDVLTYDNLNPLRITSQEGTTRSSTFSVKNTGNVILASPTFLNNIDLSDSDGDTITLTFSIDPSGNLNPGSTASITASANFANGIELGTYSGDVNVTSGTATDSFKMELVVQPEICSDGIVKDGVPTSFGNSHLDINIKEPDDGDDIKPGDVIDVEVKVKNNDDSDLDVVVEAIFYNLNDNDEITNVESDAENINDGDSETFNLEVKVPTSSDLDVDDTYVLFVKAYEDSNEDENCNEDEVTLDLERDSHDTVVKSITLRPSVAQCTENVEIEVVVENQGEKDEKDVYIQVRNTELGLDIESNKFDLDDYKGRDERATKRFNFVIPDGVSAKDYLIEAVVFFDREDEKHSDFKTLKIRECGVSDDTSDTGKNLGVVLTLTTDTQISADKNLVNLHLILNNGGNSDLSGILSFVPIGNWAQSVTGQPISLHAGANNIYLPVKLNEVQPGVSSATVTIGSAGNSKFVEKQFTLNFNIIEGEGNKITGSVVSNNFDFLKGRGTAFWVTVDIILVILGLVFLKALFGRKVA